MAQSGATTADLATSKSEEPRHSKSGRVTLRCKNSVLTAISRGPAGQIDSPPPDSVASRGAGPRHIHDTCSPDIVYSLLEQLGQANGRRR
jgi:hypothetical protein